MVFNMKSSKGIIALAMVVSIVLGLCFTASAASTKAKIVLDGRTIATNVSVYYEKNVVMVPLVVIAENIGGDVSYDKQNKTTVVTADHTVKLTPKSKTMLLDGKEQKMDTVMNVYNNKTYVSLKLFSDIFGVKGSFNIKNKTVTLTYFTSLTGSLKLSGSTTIYPVADKVAKVLTAANSGLSITVAQGGSGVGVKDAASGAVNIGMSSASLSDSQKAQYPDLEQTQIGSDAIAIITNKANSISNLTKKQVFDIFTGKITNWKEVGGKNAPIFAQVRESTSGTAASFFDLAIKPIDGKAAIPSSFTPSISSGALMQAVNANENAIGYDSYGYINPKLTNPISVEGVVCNDANVNGLKWPYTRTLVLLTLKKPTGLTAIFINYIRSLEGQKIMKEMEYIELRNKLAKKVH